MNRLKELRTKRNLTLQELSEKTGISANSLGGYEKETINPTSFMLEILADFYNVSIDYLLGRRNDFTKYFEMEAENERLKRDLYEIKKIVGKEI